MLSEFSCSSEPIISSCSIIANNLSQSIIMSVRLYIGNLPFEVSGDDLNTLFSTIGVVEDAIIVTQPGGGRPRGFGFVEMQDEQDAHLAIEQLDGQPIAGRAIKVNVANSRDD